MKPRRIVIVRHGESEGNIDPTRYSEIPDHRIELTENGYEQAVESGREIRRYLGEGTLRFYFSPYRRSVRTMKGIISAFEPSRIDRTEEEPRIREQEWGQLCRPEAMDVFRRARDSFGRFYYRMPGGESGADVYDRVSTFLETLHRAFEKPVFPENCVIVTHGLTLRLFLMRWYHWSVEFFESLEEPANCHYAAMELQPDGKKYTLAGASSEFPRRISF